MKLIIFLSVHFITSVFGQINWGNNDWATQCDFFLQDLSNVPTANDQCGPKCLSTPRCTHFTWTSWNGGTCWMKYGQASKSNAFLTSDPTMVCGVNPVSSSPNS